MSCDTIIRITNLIHVVYVYNEYKLHLANNAKMWGGGGMIFVSDDNYRLSPKSNAVCSKWLSSVSVVQ
jgi:hypothetical protein